MTKDEAISILEELKEYQKIVEYIDTHFVYSECQSDRIRRGTLMTEVALALGTNKNPKFWDRVKKAANAKGFKCVKINGIKMYKNAKRKV